jgi:hypothetical protein
MNQPTQQTYADTRQGQQMKAALAIAKMSQHELPDIGHWLISDKDARVRGMIAYSHHDRLAALTEWATFVGAARPQLTWPKDVNGLTRVSAQGTYRSVPVEIWFDAGPMEIAEIEKNLRGAS